MKRRKNKTSGSFRHANYSNSVFPVCSNRSLCLKSIVLTQQPNIMGYGQDIVLAVGDAFYSNADKFTQQPPRPKGIALEFTIIQSQLPCRVELAVQSFGVAVTQPTSQFHPGYWTTNHITRVIQIVNPSVRFHTSNFGCCYRCPFCV